MLGSEGGRCIDSWRSFPINYTPNYENLLKLQSVEHKLTKCAPLVALLEISDLFKGLSRVTLDEAFVLHCGECAESFLTTPDDILAYLKLMFGMEEVLCQSLTIPVIKIGRIAGQFAKPRSSRTETRNGVTLPSYCGDMVNSIEFTKKARSYDPQKLIKAYHKSSAVLDSIRKHLSLFDNERAISNNYRQRVYTSHESLVLNYEQALTRQINDSYYNLGAHFLWVGNKTAKIDEAHIEYISRIANPVAIKIDSNMNSDYMLKLIEKVNPENILGRLTFINRMGAEKIEEYLPNLMFSTKCEGKAVIWLCDPMHGNTKLSPEGYKIRYLDEIKSEISSFFSINVDINNYLGGIHLELTVQDVFECLYKGQEIDFFQYKALCDPRLNCSQALDLVSFIAQGFNKRGVK